MNTNLLISKCPWCLTQYTTAGITNCSNCGGTLEYANRSIGNGPGPRPPMAPRLLPKKYIRRVKYTGNVFSMIGVVFTVVFFWSVIFPVIGIFLWRKGLKDAKAELIPLEFGSTTEGEISSIKKDYSKKMNGQSPFIVEFIFDVHGKKFRGSVGNIFDSVDLSMQTGDKIWVVYMPEDPENFSSIWPPLK